jgi:ribosomal protein S18 acetylase RimI-like enzyme
VTSDETDQLVTIYLEMRAPEQLRPKRVTSGQPSRGYGLAGKWRVTSLETTEDAWRFNRDMYFRVGEQWRWIDKRPWTDEQWKEYAMSPALRTFAAHYDGALVGYYELRTDENSDIEIAYFGLLPEFIGRGLGGALLTNAIEEAWRSSPTPFRVWVHTCNRDHPQALANYQARGMIAYKVEENAN